MRRAVAWVGMACVVALSGCVSPLTEAEARAICDSVGSTEGNFTGAVGLAQEDEAEGLTAAESLDLFRGDCDDACGEDTECYNDCLTCADAVVRYVYSD